MANHHRSQKATAAAHQEGCSNCASGGKNGSFSALNWLNDSVEWRGSGSSQQWRGRITAGALK
jgi:hypothetical protein